MTNLDLSPAYTLTLGIDDTFTIKHDGRTIHIAGITTETGSPVCSVLANRSLQTGHTFDSLADALAAVEASSRVPCRVCWVGATLILNRKR